MEEQFILRVPPSIAERLDLLLSESENASSSEDKSLDLTFSEDGRSGTFVIANDHFPASLLDLPSVVESYKTYDDSVLIKTADIGQMIMVREAGDPAPDMVEYRHGLTPPMRDARKRRFRREPDLNVLNKSLQSFANKHNRKIVMEKKEKRKNNLCYHFGIWTIILRNMALFHLLSCNCKVSFIEKERLL
ncbi:transcription initiation factor TFIID subunit 7-like isoform X3 [Carya illinoinensis]|uniref:transcription initiation factor TFIID subunit 7-like isoform X3 n=1 Tax=Carya illinoinensis TaxID=32201 RepID=UPI001C719006|nr:transcription initiation factor TFIID subunit 7-like isoform X3 [Carya illinoinensis]